MGIISLLSTSKRFTDLSLFILIITLSSCLKDDGSLNETVPGTLVSIVHASPDAGNLLIGINGNRVNNQNFNFGNRIIYQLLYPGTYQFQVNSVSDNKALAIKNWGLEPGMCYTIFITDRLDSLKLLNIQDFRYGENPDEGFAGVRFINLSPDSLSLDLQADGIDTLLASAKKFRENSAFGGIVAANRDYTLHLLNHDSGEVLSTLSFTPKEGKYYTIMAKGLMGTEVEGQKFGALILTHD